MQMNYKPKSLFFGKPGIINFISLSQSKKIIHAVPFSRNEFVNYRVEFTFKSKVFDFAPFPGSERSPETPALEAGRASVFGQVLAQVERTLGPDRFDMDSAPACFLRQDADLHDIDPLVGDHVDVQAMLLVHLEGPQAA